MSYVEVQEVFAKWADKAWTGANGDWRDAQSKFLEIRDAELSSLSPVLAEAVEAEVWRFFANHSINTIVQRLRAQSRAASTTPQSGTTQPPTGGRSRRTSAASDSNESTRLKLFLDDFHLTTSRVSLRNATFDQVTVEAEMRQAKATTFGRDAKMLFAIRDKMKGHIGGTKVGDVVEDAFVEKLKKQIYAV